MLIVFHSKPVKVFTDGLMNAFHVNMLPQLLNLFSNNPYMSNTLNLTRFVCGSWRIDSPEVD